MKKYSNLSLTGCAIIIFLFLSGCKKALDLKPAFFQPTNSTTETQLTYQLAGAYNVLTNDAMYGQGLWGYLSAGTDEGFRAGISGTTTNSITETYSMTTTDAKLLSFWSSCYIGIERANVILDLINQPDMPQETRNSIKGQALFLRGYYHYLLVTHFGGSNGAGVVLRLIPTSALPTDLFIGRTPSAKVYKQIYSDMVAADSLVPDFSLTRSTLGVTKDAVEGILARVCLSWAGFPLNEVTQYDSALKWSTSVINRQLHGLNTTPYTTSNIMPIPKFTSPAYSRVFINNMQNNGNRLDIANEGIWDASFTSKSNNSGTYANTGIPVTQQLGALMGVTCLNATSIVGYSSGSYRAFPSLYNLFEIGDQRRDWVISPFIYQDSGYNTTKYPFLGLTIIDSLGKGIGATASVGSYNPDGSIASINVDNGGSGYSSTNPPGVNFNLLFYNATTYIRPKFTATVVGGKVVNINIVSAGAGLQSIYERPIAKWRREYEINNPPVRQQNFTSSNFPILRYADVLLMAAEANLNAASGNQTLGLEYLNQVRRRAFGYTNISTPNPIVDKTSLTKQLIMDERLRELCFEGQRRIDLIRWGAMQQVMQNLSNSIATTLPTSAATSVTVSAALAVTNFLSSPTKYMVFPIPDAEISATNDALVQDPNW